MMQNIVKSKRCGRLAAAALGAVSLAHAQTPTLTPAPSASPTKPAGSSSTTDATHTSPAAAQTPSAPAGALPATPQATSTPLAGSSAQTAGAGASAAAQSGTAAITLSDAIGRSQASDLNYATALSDAQVSAAQRGIALAGILPTVVYHNQFIYTQPLHGPTNATNSNTISGGTPRFIANNTVHEYVSQGLATETIGAAGITDFRRSYYELAAARARVEVARRGLVETVITNYYGALAAAEKAQAFQQALDEAHHFDIISKQLEAGGEVAHADVIKSRLQVQQRERDLSDAQLVVEKARIDLGVLLFSNPLTTFGMSGDLHTLPPLPSREQVKAAANNDNPDLKAALNSFHAASLELTSARFDYLPSLSLQYSYGIDAPQFAATATDGSRNLGYAAVATLDIPVFDFFATRDRARQAAARKQLASVTLSSTQRRLAASIENLYREAEVAQQQTISLEASVKDATEALRLSDLRYTNGEGSILEVVDAQNTLITTQNARADGAARYYAALATLQTLTGSLP